MYVPSIIKKGILFLSILPTLSLYAANSQYISYERGGEDFNRGGQYREGGAGEQNRGGAGGQYNRGGAYNHPQGAYNHPEGAYNHPAAAGAAGGYQRGEEQGELNENAAQPQQQAPVIVVPPGGNGYQQQNW